MCQELWIEAALIQNCAFSPRILSKAEKGDSTTQEDEGTQETLILMLENATHFNILSLHFLLNMVVTYDLQSYWEIKMKQHVKMFQKVLVKQVLPN